MKLSPAPEKYDRASDQQMRNALEREDDRNAKIDRDIPMVTGAGQIVTDTDGTGRRWRIVVTAGVPAAVLVT